MGISAAALAGFQSSAMADDDPVVTRNLFGSPGLVDMPDARMAPDGELSVGASFFENTQRYNFGFQVMPWLETSFRYSGFSHYDPGYPVYYDRSFAFKIRLWNESDYLPALAVGVNDAVGTGLYHSQFIVASKRFGDIDATLGMGFGRLGTANTITNPFTLISNSFKGGNTEADPGAANFSGLFHGPNAGIFGGITWQTPLENLALSAEISSDNYTLERSHSSFVPKSQYNIGASYQVADSIALNLDWIYGKSVAGSLIFQLDPVHDSFSGRLGPSPPQPHIRDPEQQQQALYRLKGQPSPTNASRINHSAFVDAIWKSSIAADDVAINGRTLVLHVSAADPAAICTKAAAIAADSGIAVTDVNVVRSGRTTRCTVLSPPRLQEAAYSDNPATAGIHDLLLARNTATTIDASAAPQIGYAAAIATIRKDLGVQRIALQALSLQDGQAIVYYTNLRYFSEKQALERMVRVLMADAPGDIEKFRFIAVVNNVPQREFDILRGPAERAAIQGDDLLGDDYPGGPATMHNPVLAAAARDSFPRFSWSIFPQFRQELFDPSNPFAVQFLAGGSAMVELWPGFSLQGEAEFSLYDNFNLLRPASSDLPHVRTDFLKYFSEGKNGVGNLEADYNFRLSPTVFAVARAGYLESMFAGVGGEVLWRPEHQRWALGVDLYEVKQRDFDRMFGLQGYHVFTGHVSLYYASPWYDLNLAVHAGQYLAGDRGLTFEMTRRFSTGVEIGAFFTKTNVSAEQFGEGSFDKGIIIRIPLQWSLPVDTQSQLALDLRPVQRDGGQRLQGDTLLYEETRRTSEAEFDLQRNSLIE